ncbi:MAG TPA: hypothetical protein VJ599_06460 [Nitrososphaeraceae archaeon]|nr:hypothetical protein [Nitrososphaeraceae archaeon]
MNKFYSRPESKNNTGTNSGDEMLDFVISRGHGILQTLTNVPFDISYFYEVNGLDIKK